MPKLPNIELVQFIYLLQEDSFDMTFQRLLPPPPPPPQEKEFKSNLLKKGFKKISKSTLKYQTFLKTMKSLTSGCCLNLLGMMLSEDP